MTYSAMHLSELEPSESDSVLVRLIVPTGTDDELHLEKALH